MAASTSQVSSLEHLDKSNAALLGLLAMLEPGKEICAARMVNLAYLLDEFSYQHDAATLTCFGYTRGDDGPNVVDDDVENRLDLLVRKGLVHYTETPASPDYPAKGYEIDGQVNLAKIPLSVDDWALIHSVIRKYGGLNREEMLDALRRTPTMRNTPLHSRLRFQRNTEIEAFKQSVREDADFMEECMAALADGFEGVTIEELRGAVVAEQIDS